MKLILESLATKKGRILEGIALTPTISLNGNIYAAEEIDAVNGLNVPLKADWEHTEEIIGNVIYKVDPESHTLFYTATITDDRRSSEIKEGVHKVSIEADVAEVIKSCTKKRCYNMPIGLTMEGIGITKTPGVLTATLNIVESHQDWKPIIESHCPTCKVKEVDVNAIVTDILTKELLELEKRIQLKYELLKTYEAVLEILPLDCYLLDQYNMCKDELRWLVDRYMTLLKEYPSFDSKSITTVNMEKLGKLKDENIHEKITMDLNHLIKCPKCKEKRKR